MNKTAYFISLAGIISVCSIKAQDDGAGKTMPLFQSAEILNLDLEADFKTVFSVKDDSTYFPARISLTDNYGLKKTVDIKIRTRGKTRLKKSICGFAPLRLNFPRSEVKNTPFEGQNAIKLVTHCDKTDHYEQNTMIEYLIYKAFNVLTDSSFKVRPAMINYVHSDEKEDTVKKFAFFIEREKHLAERLRGTELESQGIHPDRVDQYQTCLVDMFQYMIGNTDYSIYEMHNIIFVTDSAGKFPPFPVPYDFDWSGLVSAVYAVPNPLLKTEHVSERVYRGLKKESGIVYHAISVFNAKKQEIYQLFENFGSLNSNEKKDAIKYLDEFYGIINDENKVRTEFFDHARVLDQ